MAGARHSLLLLLLLALTTGSDAYPTGAPGDNNGDVCNTLTPNPGVTGHNSQPQTSPAPFGITLSSNTYTPGGSEITVTIEKRCSVSFKGFLLTTVYADKSQTANPRPGTFPELPVGTKRTCSDGALAPYTNRAVTHNNPALKDSLTFRWIPPTSANSGHIIFRATFVQDKSTFWVDVHSELLVDSSRGQPTDVTNFVTPGSASMGPGCVAPTTTPTPTTTTTTTSGRDSPTTTGGTGGGDTVGGRGEASVLWLLVWACLGLYVAAGRV